MQIEIYAVKDKKAGFFLKPFDSRGVTDAIRAITEVARDEKSLLYKHAEDYQLFLLGKMEDMTGVISTECKLEPPTWSAPMLILEISTLNKDLKNA